MAFLKFTTIMGFLVSAYAAPAPQFYAHAPPPPPPVARVAVAPPPPPPAVYRAAPAPVYGHQAQFVPIVSQSYDASPDGSYTFQYESADGSARQEQGISRSPPGSEGPGGVAVQGRYVYANEAGAPIQVDYIADENGYQPSGKDVHPAIVEAVAQQVAFARSEPAQAYHAAPPAYRAPPPPPPPAVYAKSAFAPVPPPVAYATPAPYAYPYKA